jgi:hypothetical protein
LPGPIVAGPISIGRFGHGEFTYGGGLLGCPVIFHKVSVIVGGVGFLPVGSESLDSHMASPGVFPRVERDDH